MLAGVSVAKSRPAQQPLYTPCRERATPVVNSRPARYASCMNTDDCRPDCPCKARNAKDAIDRASKLLGFEYGSGLLWMLQNHGWSLVRDDKETTR